MRDLLACRDLTLSHGTRPVLTGVAVRARAGALTALLGANGSGKSTLLRALAGLHRPDQGEVMLGGEDVTRMKPLSRAQRIAFLPQAPLLPSGTTVRRLVGYGRHPHQGLFASASADDKAAVAEAIVTADLEELADRSVEHLSGGERQRAWVAMVLAQQAPVLLLDEPTTFLDIRYQLDVLSLLRRLIDERGLTVVIVLHDLNQAAAFADELVLLAEGGVVAAGPPPEVLTTAHVARAFAVDVTVVVDPATGVPSCLFPDRHAVTWRSPATQAAWVAPPPSGSVAAARGL